MHDCLTEGSGPIEIDLSDSSTVPNSHPQTFRCPDTCGNSPLSPRKRKEKKKLTRLYQIKNPRHPLSARGPICRLQNPRRQRRVDHVIAASTGSDAVVGMGTCGHDPLPRGNISKFRLSFPPSPSNLTHPLRQKEEGRSHHDAIPIYARPDGWTCVYLGI